MMVAGSKSLVVMRSINVTFATGLGGRQAGIVARLRQQTGGKDQL
jgi:hypothetical protein